MGPVVIAENVGAIRIAVSGKESGSCGDTSGVANAPDDVGTLRACGSVASGTTVVELLRLAEDALTALDAGEIDLAKERLRAFVAAARWASGERAGCGPRTEP